MAKKYLGKTLDIHGGGSDLLFPHHENECAQSMCSHSGKPLANYWVHNGMIDFDNVKMSKSEGNLLLIRDLLQEIRPEVIRMAFLSTHYRKPINWNDALIIDSEKKLDRLYGSIRKLGELSPDEPPEGILNAIADDINTPKALSELFAIVKNINNAKSNEESKQLGSILIGSANLLGLMNESAESWFDDLNMDVDEALILRLLGEREEARSNKDFGKADQIRQKIESLGVSIEDGPNGPVWMKK
jgi:cysteinyl-tRNA synthetase